MNKNYEDELENEELQDEEEMENDNRTDDEIASILTVMVINYVAYLSLGKGGIWKEKKRY